MNESTWMRWLAGLIVIVALAAGGAWFSGRMYGGVTIHFWLDDAGGVEPGTTLHLSGVRAGVVISTRLEGDASRGNRPRGSIEARLTPEAARLVNREEWEVLVTRSPLPGFKSGLDLVPRRGAGELPEDGSWASRSESAVAGQVAYAFDAIMEKLASLPEGGLRAQFPDLGGEDGENRALVRWLLTDSQLVRLDAIMANLDAISAEAARTQRDGGLARLALGDKGYDNLLLATADLAETTRQLSATAEEDGMILRLLFGPAEREKVADLVATLSDLSTRVAAVDLGPAHRGMEMLDDVSRTLRTVSASLDRIIGPAADGSPGELERELAKLPQQIGNVYRTVERASGASDELMLQTAEVLRKANQTLASVNQLLTGLKRSFIFRGIFNEALKYDDLAPFLTPAGPEPLPYDYPQGGR